MLRRAATAPRAPPRPLPVGAGDAHMRLDRFVRSRLPSLPQSLIQRLTRRRAISVSEPGAQPRKAAASERLSEGMVVFVPGDIEQQIAKPTRQPVRSHAQSVCACALCVCVCARVCARVCACVCAVYVRIDPHLRRSSPRRTCV